jgi:hypothetical protein
MKVLLVAGGLLYPFSLFITGKHYRDILPNNTTLKFCVNRIFANTKL